MDARTEVKPAMRTQGSLRIVVPQIVRQVFNLLPGDALTWELKGSDETGFYFMVKKEEAQPSSQ